MLRLCILLCLLSLLAGCAENPPHVFGMPLHKWNNLPETKKQELIGQYGVNNLSHYSNEPKITMDAIPTPPLLLPTEPQPAANETKKSVVIEIPKPAAAKTNLAPKKIEMPALATQQIPTGDNWLKLDS